MTEEELIHREMIRALVMQFNMHSDRGRFADVAACFAVDGKARWHTGQGEGRKDIEARLRRATSNPAITFVRHHVTTMLIELAPDMRSATGRIYFFSISNAGVDHAGVYVDSYVREEGEWLIASRESCLDWQASDSMYPR